MGVGMHAILCLVQAHTRGGAALLVRSREEGGGEVLDIVPERGQVGSLLPDFDPDDAAGCDAGAIRLPLAYATVCGEGPIHMDCASVGQSMYLLVLSCAGAIDATVMEAARLALAAFFEAGHVTMFDRQLSARLAEMVRVMPIPFIFVDRQGQQVFANDRALRLLGVGLTESRASVIGPALTRLIKIAGGAALRLALDDDGRGSASFTLEHQGRVQKVDTDWIERGPLCGRVWAFHDITAERELEDELRRLASTDYLTGALNRRAFELGFRGDVERAHRLGTPISLIMLDLDHFKRANDTHGHEAGDRILREVCRRISSVLREGDRLARLGGEEFAVLLIDTTLAQAQAVAERIRLAICTQPVDVGLRVDVTCSLGLTIGNDGSDDRAGMMERADAALYQAKAAGRNCVRVFG